MIDVSIHGITAKNAKYDKTLDILFFRFESLTQGNLIGGHGTIFFDNKEKLDRFIANLVEAEAAFVRQDEETIHFSQ